jgi:peptidoglycan/xylan/chitin deacetylase (PgdA/CDA1 family)
MSLAERFKTKLTSLMARKLAVRPAKLAGHRPVASITFDDFPKNAWVQGGPVMARHGVRGTYYTAGGFCGRTVEGTQFYDGDDLRQLAAAGHEIACHGFGHQPTPTLTTEELTKDVERNKEFLRPFLGGDAPVSYAFPYGRVSPRTKRFYAPRFASVRGVHPGINAGRVDLAQLNTISLETRCWDEAKIEAAIQRVLHENGWLILYTHDVSDSPSPYGSTPAMLNWALARVAAARIRILPVCDALPVALGL